MRRLADRVVLISGSTGITAATAELTTDEGRAAFILSRTADHAHALADRCDGAAWAAADLTVYGEVEAAVTAAIDRFGRVDNPARAFGFADKNEGAP